MRVRVGMRVRLRVRVRTRVRIRVKVTKGRTHVSTYAKESVEVLRCCLTLVHIFEVPL